MDGNPVLLTGENGSGKLTIVDALLTLLVSNQRRNYNLSSGSGRRERSEVTYVKGAYGREQDKQGIAKIKFCRNENGNCSVLLARFTNYLLKENFTIAQFFWFDSGELKKFYVTANENLSIEKHFSEFQIASSLRIKLKSISHVNVYDSFSEYQINFLSAFGTKSLKAMDLFNQVVAIKEVGSLSEFVRKHMLEPKSVQDLIDQLFSNYENLNLSHQAILSARSQLDFLTPIGELNDLLCKQKKELDLIEQEEKKTPLFFNHKRKSVLDFQLYLDQIVQLKYFIQN